MNVKMEQYIQLGICIVLKIKSKILRPFKDLHTEQIHVISKQIMHLRSLIKQSGAHIQLQNKVKTSLHVLFNMYMY